VRNNENLNTLLTATFYHTSTQLMVAKLIIWESQADIEKLTTPLLISINT